MSESESDALPLGDTPIFEQVILYHYNSGLSIVFFKKIEKNCKFFRKFSKNPLTKARKTSIIYHVVMGHRQAVRHQTLTLTFPGFESLCPSQEKRPTRKSWSFFNDVCLRQMMLATPMMAASPNDVCLRAHKGKHRIIASETSNIILSEAKNIISP